MTAVKFKQSMLRTEVFGEVQKNLSMEERELWTEREHLGAFMCYVPQGNVHQVMAHDTQRCCCTFFTHLMWEDSMAEQSMGWAQSAAGSCMLT